MWLWPCLASSALCPACVSLSPFYEREREREKGTGKGKDGGPISLCLSVFPPSLPERETRGEGRAGVDGCRFALPSGVALPCPALPPLSLSLYFSPSSSLPKGERSKKGRAGVDGFRPALPYLPSALLASISLSLPPSVKREREGERWREREGEGEGERKIGRET